MVLVTTHILRHVNTYGTQVSGAFGDRNMIVCAMTKDSSTKLKFYVWESLDQIFAQTSSMSLPETWSPTPTGFPTVAVSGTFQGMDCISITVAVGADASWLVAVASTGSDSGVYAFGGSMGAANLIVATDTRAYSAQFFQKAGILYVAFGTATGIDGKRMGS